VIRARRKGVTLLEIVLAVSLGIGLVASLITLHRQARRLRNNVVAQAEKSTAVGRVLDRITEDLRSSISYQFIAQGLTKDAGKMEFVTASLPFPVAFAEADVTDPRTNPPPRHDHQIVGYSIRVATDDAGNPLEDENGQIVVLGLQRASQSVLTATAEEGREIATSLLSPTVRFIHFRYFDGAEWLEQWDSPDMPAAVEVAVGFKPAPQDTAPADYPYETHWRVVSVPAGKKTFEGAVLRGLDEGGGP